jgi:ER lumen protein retaining receptor
MDPLLILGDILHILALFFLLLKINSTNNVRGVSYKTQEIYLIVFLTRYSDMLIIRYRFHGYFVITRLLLIGITALIIYYTRCKLPHSKVFILLLGLRLWRRFVSSLLYLFGCGCYRNCHALTRDFICLLVDLFDLAISNGYNSATLSDFQMGINIKFYNKYCTYAWPLSSLLHPSLVHSF